MVIGPTVGERVTLDIIEKLREINGPPDYSFDVSQAVLRMEGSALELTSYPAVIVVDAGTEETDGAVNGLIQVSHTYDVILATVAHSPDWSADVRLLAADCAAKLREDWTRGGIAHTTKVEVSDTWDEDREGTGVVGGALSVIVIYRHLYGDPTIPY